MGTPILIVLAFTCGTSLLAAVPIWLVGRRAAALSLLGSALTLVCAGSMLAMALQAAGRDTLNLNAPGLAALALAAALAGSCFYGVRKPALQAITFWFASAVNLAIACFLMYLLLAFKIQF
jgi:hypothetical protein